jgi:hypothetical protein
MPQPCPDCVDIDTGTEQVCGGGTIPSPGLCQPLLRKLQKHSECVAIGTDRVRTDLSLLQESLCKETFQKRCERRIHHGRFSQQRSSRIIASRISSAMR